MLGRNFLLKKCRNIITTKNIGNPNHQSIYRNDLSLNSCRNIITTTKNIRNPNYQSIYRKELLNRYQTRRECR